MARNPKSPRDPSDGNSGRRPSKPKRPKSRKTDLSPFLNYPLASMDDGDFRSLCDEIRALLGPRNEMEHRGIEMILWSFQRVRRAQQAIEMGVPHAEFYLKTMIEAFRSRQKTFDLLRKVIDSDPEAQDLPLQCLPFVLPHVPLGQELAPDWSPPAASTAPPQPQPEPESSPEPPPFVVGAEELDPIESREAFDEYGLEDDVTDFDAYGDEVDEIEAAAHDWRSRIAMVPSVDARWPVLDQFDLRVDDILTMRDRGVPEDEVLEQYPGLTYSDLACCYACESEGYRGPLEPPYPADITIVEDEPESD